MWAGEKIFSQFYVENSKEDQTFHPTTKIKCSFWILLHSFLLFMIQFVVKMSSMISAQVHEERSQGQRDLLPGYSRGNGGNLGDESIFLWQNRLWGKNMKKKEGEKCMNVSVGTKGVLRDETRHWFMKTR